MQCPSMFDLRVDPLYVHPLFFPDERDSAREAHLESTSTRVDVSQHLAGALQALSPTVYRNWLYFDSDGLPVVMGAAAGRNA